MIQVSPDMYKVPKNIEQAVPIANTHPTDIAFATIFFSVGLVMKSFWVSIILLMGALWVLRKFREGAKRGYTNHYLWRVGITFFDNKLKRYFPHPSKDIFFK